MALVDLMEFRIEFGLGAAGDSGSVWDTALWDEGTWSSDEIQWSDFSSLVERYTTSTGKRSTQPTLKRFRTGTAIFTMDNTDGVFIPGSNETPGFLNLRPGRHVRILARKVGGFVPPSSTPIPDGTTWQDSTGRTWTAHGDGLTLESAGSEAPAWEPIWRGRIDTILNRHRDGNLQATVRCIDDLAWLAQNNTIEQASQGEGESASDRITRILDHAGYPEGQRDIGADPKTMQATTLAQDALSMAQLVADSTGGDFYQTPSGNMRYRPQGWMSEDVDWVLGGPVGIPVDAVTPEWSSLNVLNEVHYSRAGGVEQVATDTTSIVLYGRKTHQRFDFVNDNDVDVLELANLTVKALGVARQFLAGVSVMVQDEETADFVTGVEIGQKLRITVDTIWGWSTTTDALVIGISDRVDASAWIMDLTLQDAAVVNEYGPFARPEFSSAFHLGGEAP